MNICSTDRQYVSQDVCEMRGRLTMQKSAGGQAECADAMRVLADGTRLSVVNLLMERACHVHELNDVLGLEATLLSHHLRVLRDAGLVIAERDGKAVLYRLAPSVHRGTRSRTLDLGCCKLRFT